MSEFLDLEKLNDPLGTAHSIGFWIYYLQEDRLKLSKSSMENFGIKTEEPYSLIRFKSHILGVDIPIFIQGLKKWLMGDTSSIISIRIINNHNQLKTFQIKGHIRFDEDGDAIQLYGAYIDISNWEN